VSYPNPSHLLHFACRRGIGINSELLNIKPTVITGLKDQLGLGHIGLNQVVDDYKMELYLIGGATVSGLLVHDHLSIYLYALSD
jgi:hypothetical protein